MSIKNIVSSQLPEITTYDSTGNITGIVVDTVTANTVSSAGNIDSPGNIAGANLLTSGQVIATGNVNGGNIVTPGQVVATGNIIGDNFLTSGLVFAAGDVSAANFNTAGTANVGTLAVVGNATVANNMSVTGNASAANYSTAGVVTAGGNITGANLVTAGVVAATGNVIGANLVSPGDVDISGNVYANYVFATGNIVADGNVDAAIVNTTDIVGDTVTIASTGVDADIFVNPNGFGNIVVNSSYINGVLNPVQAQDVATKDYVDSVAVGLQYKVASNVATTVGLPAYSYNNGTLGVGATITGNVNGVLTIDTVTTTAGMRVLVKNEVGNNAPYNGIYSVTAPGDAGNVYVLTRSTDDDTATDMNGAYTFIESGNINGTTSWTCTATTANPVVIGTDPINWIQFARPSTYQPGNGLSLNGTVFNVNVDNNTTAIVGANVVVKASANLTTPNIGNATGNSLVLSGGGKIIATEMDLSGIAVIAGNATTGNLATGAVVATGNISGNNLTLTGTMTAGGTATAGNLVTGGNLSVAGKSTLGDSVSALTNLYVGPTANTASLTGPVVFAQGASNAFSQMGLQSINGNSSADLIAYANNGTDSDGFADIGMTGNTFNDTNYTVTKPNDGYVFVQGTTGLGGNLVLATGDVGNTHDIVFATGGFLAANEKMRLVDATATLQPTANTGVDLGSTTNYFGNLYVNTATLGGNLVTTGNISGNYIIGNGSQLTGLPAGYTNANVTALLASGNVSSNVVTTGNISGNYFIGNGALLTGISSGGNATAINNGTSNVRIMTANGNITMSVANVSNVVTVTSDSLRVAGNIFDTTGQVYGVAASFMSAGRTTAQTTNLGPGNAVVFNQVNNTFGTDITLNTGTGQITLQAGKTYRLMASPGYASFSGVNGFLIWQWYNVTAGVYFGNQFSGDSTASSANSAASYGPTVVMFTPSVNTVVQLNILNQNLLVGLGQTGTLPYVDVQVIGGQAPLTAGYVATSFVKYTRTTDQTTGITANSAIICNVQEASAGSDITVDVTTGNVTVAAGKSYRLRGTIGYIKDTGTSVGAGYQWYNVTTASWVGQGGMLESPTVVLNPYGNPGTAEYVVTPSVTTVFQLRLVVPTNLSAIGAISAPNATFQIGAPFIDVQVIGGQIPVTNTAQYGSATTVVADNTQVGTTQGTATTVLSYALPTGGTYQIEATVTVKSSSGAILWALFDNAGTLVPNSITQGFFASAGNLFNTVSNSFIVTATGATTYTVRAWSNPTGFVMNNATNGFTKGLYTQIGGFLPITNGTAFNTITSITSGSTTTSALPALMPGSAFTLDAGTYQLNYVLSLFSNSNYGTFATLWNVTTNTEVAASATFGGYEGTTAGNYFSLSGGAIVTVTTPTVFAIYWASGLAGQTSTVLNNYSGTGTIAQGVGDSTITYTQIGTLPPAVQSVVAASAAKFTRSTSQNGVAANTVVVCNVQEALIGSTIAVNTTTGNVTLEAGGTYRLRGGIGLFDSPTGRISYCWWNATTSSWIGEPAVAHSVVGATSVAEYMGSAECVITPTITTVVQLKVIAVSATGIIGYYPPNNTVDAGLPFIDIEQIGGFIPSNSITQYGIATNIVADNITISSNSATPTNVMTVNIPAAGTWNITPTINWGTNSLSSGFYALYRATTPASSNIVAGTLSNMAAIGPGTGIGGSSSTTWTVVTTGPTTFTVGAYSTAGAIAIYNGNNGQTRATFTQIAGQIATAALPALSLAKFTRTTDQTGVAANSVVICNVAEATAGGDIDVNTTTGNITLLANNTYRLRGTVGYCNTTNVTNAAMSYQWWNATTGAWVGQGGGVVSASSGATDAWQSGTAEYVFTPSTTTVVQLRVVGTSNSNAITPESGSAFATVWRIGAPFIDVEVIGTQAPSSGVPNWTNAGTLQAVGIAGTTTAPSFGTIATTIRNSVRYKQIGPKTYQLMMTLNISGLSGGTPGSGDYLFSLPAGLQFDNSIYPAYTGQVQQSSYVPFNYQIPGATGFMNGGNGAAIASIGQMVIVPWNATQYRVWWTYSSTVQAWGSSFYQLGGFTAYDTNWQFTFQST